MKKILIIDDDKGLLDVFEMIFQEKGFEVISLPKKPSLDAIVEMNPNLILLDYLLENELGNELCLRLKKKSATNHIPVILISAYPKLKDVATRCQADDFVSKPFDVTDLENKVDSLINLSFVN